MILDQSKLKKIKCDPIIEIYRYVMGTVENVGKDGNAVLPAFSPLPTVYSKAFFLRNINLTPENRILDLYKLKAFAGNNFNLAGMVQLFSDWVEIILGKGENACFQPFF